MELGPGHYSSQIRVQTVMEFGEVRNHGFFITLAGLGERPGPEVIQLFSRSFNLSMTFILLINVKMSTAVGILTFISRIIQQLGILGKISILN